jgi:hypothetical protein
LVPSVRGRRRIELPHSVQHGEQLFFYFGPDDRTSLRDQKNACASSQKLTSVAPQ